MTAARHATFAARWHQAVATVPDRLFLRWEDRQGATTEWTYAQFDALIARVAGGLVERDVRPGDPVHLALPNAPAFVAVWLAATSLGAWIVPSDPGSTSREIGEHLARTHPKLSVHSREQRTAFDDAAVRAPESVAVDVDDTTLSELRGEPVRRSDADPVRPDQRAAVLFTSGTTSAPKGVVITQANYAFAGDVMAAAAGLTQRDRQLVALPLFHANAQYYSFASAISVGASVALLPSFSATCFLDQARRHGATHASLFAAPMRMILAKNPDPVPDLQLEHVWYAQNVTAEQYQRLAELFGCRPRQLYGMTETIPAVLSNRAMDVAIDGIGTPTLGCEVDLFAPGTSRRVAEGEVGEIVVGGIPGTSLFAGYLDDPTTTQSAFEDGWFRTGDRARRDANGRFFFDGRQGEVLKVSGENVSLVEIEAVVGSHPGVLEAAVVGEPDAVRDEVPVAFVVPLSAAGLQIDDLQRYCDERLAPAKRPRRYRVVDELPRTSLGKIRKYLLRADPEGESSMETPS